MRTARRFAVHVLAARPRATSRAAPPSPGADRFAEPAARRRSPSSSATSRPSTPAGDHSIVVGRVRDVRVRRDGEPLVYFAGGFGAFEAI